MTTLITSPITLEEAQEYAANLTPIAVQLTMSLGNLMSADEDTLDEMTDEILGSNAFLVDYSVTPVAVDEDHNIIIECVGTIDVNDDYDW